MWNSATTANYKEIQKRPYWEQVVEQQFEYNKAVGEDLRLLCEGRHVEIWYEDLCSDPEAAAAKIEACVGGSRGHLKARADSMPSLVASSGPEGLSEDRERIEQYVREQKLRLEKYTYEGHLSENW